MLEFLKSLLHKADHKEQALAELEHSRRELLESESQVESWSGKVKALKSRIDRLEKYTKE